VFTKQEESYLTNKREAVQLFAKANKLTAKILSEIVVGMEDSSNEEKNVSEGAEKAQLISKLVVKRIKQSKKKKKAPKKQTIVISKPESTEIEENGPNSTEFEPKLTEGDLLDYLIPKIGYSLITLLHIRATTNVARNGSLRNVPFVGQYCIFDIFYLVGHTMCSLPHNIQDFKRIVQSWFPTLIDTKIMGARFKSIISPNFMTGLNSMVNYFLNRGPQSLPDES
jgi:hypothetical protein